MKIAAETYTWINDSAIGEAGCVTVVPAGSRDPVLAAFGAMPDSARVVDTLDELDYGTGAGGPVYVVQVGEAVVVVESNGFQGARNEVLRPASKASGTGVATSFFWNINAVTAFSAARRGKPLFSVELIGSEDDELDGVPKALRPLVVDGGSEDGDMLGAGLALIAAFAKTSFTADDLRGGTVYETEPPPADLETYGPDHRYTYDLPDAPSMLAALAPDRQRQFAEWATRAAVREAGLADEPPVRNVLDQLGTGEIPTAPPSLDGLARSTAKKHDHFTNLEEDLRMGGQRVPTDHPYYEASLDGRFGRDRALSYLEGSYLGQRRTAVEAVRYVAHTDPLSAAIACANYASTTFVQGRLTRYWTFTENDRGRWRVDTLPNPRHHQFLRTATMLMEHLAAPDVTDAVLARADAELPAPFTEEQRTEAVRADATAALEGAFETYQISRGDD